MRKCKCCSHKVKKVIEDFVEYYECEKCYAKFTLEGEYFEWN